MVSNQRRFVVDASEATKLAAELRANLDALLPRVHTAVSAAAKAAQRAAKDNAPRGPHTKRIRASIRTKTRRYTTGSEVTVEVADKLGAILEYGRYDGKRNRPGLFMKAGWEAGEKEIEASISQIVSEILR